MRGCTVAGGGSPLGPVLYGVHACLVRLNARRYNQSAPGITGA